MACIILKGPLGERRVQENQPYRLGTDEAIAGVDWACNKLSSDDLESIFTKDGFLFGNLVKKVASAMGFKQCLACKGRQQSWNLAGLELQKKVGALFSNTA